MKMYMFTILDKVKPNTENIRGLNLAAVRLMTIKVTKLLLWPELLLIRYDLLHQAWTARTFKHIYIVFIEL
jgi:hypothetical protein